MLKSRVASDLVGILSLRFHTYGHHCFFFWPSIIVSSRIYRVLLPLSVVHALLQLWCFDRDKRIFAWGL